MSQPEIFESLLGPIYGASARSAVQLLNMIPEKEIVEGIGKLGHLESVGPIVDPSAWTGGDRFKRSEFMKEVLDGILKVRRASERFLEWENERSSKRS